MDNYNLRYLLAAILVGSLLIYHFKPVTKHQESYNKLSKELNWKNADLSYKSYQWSSAKKKLEEQFKKLIKTRKTKSKKRKHNNVK